MPETTTDKRNAYSALRRTTALLTRRALLSGSAALGAMSVVVRRGQAAEYQFSQYHN
jgi:hypothetical protein